MLKIGAEGREQGWVPRGGAVSPLHIPAGERCKQVLANSFWVYRRAQ